MPPHILSSVPRKLHLQPAHPVSLVRQLLEQQFPNPTFRHINALDPVVSTAQNFDSLGFPDDHPGRARSDTYYINRTTLLRTHTSAHQAEAFAGVTAEQPGYLISADVYRRDAIDRTHYPVFHQTEGALVWDREALGVRDVADKVYADLAALPDHDIVVEDVNPPFHAVRNPRQERWHSEAECAAIGAHLKRSLELLVVRIFGLARAAARRASQGVPGGDEPLKVRWVEAYFPFTSPSWELEVFHEGAWLEILGCGVVRQELLNASAPASVREPTNWSSGWAFGIGLERIAMLLFRIPDIRLFWSTDQRFLSQFKSLQGPRGDGDLSGLEQGLRPFVPFSKYPACVKDVSFWVPGPTTTSSAAGGNPTRDDSQSFHENDVMEVVRAAAGDLVEDVRLVDQFVHPKTRRRSLCYRVSYRSLERTLTNIEANEMHDAVVRLLVERLGVEIR